MKKIFIFIIMLFALFSCVEDKVIITKNEKIEIKKILENKSDLIGISKKEIDKIIKDSSSMCFKLKLLDIKEKDYIFSYNGLLEGFKIAYFNDKYVLKKLGWQIDCTDMPYKKDKIIFFNKSDNKYYLLEDNYLENFLKNGSNFFNFHKNIDKSDKNLILKKGINQKIGEINIIRELDENKGSILTLPIFEHIGKLDKRSIKYDYKNKQEGTTLFIGYKKIITKEAKGICEGDNNGKIEKSTINVYILEVSNKFEIINIEKIYGEKEVENKKYCIYYG